jgi:hypothetical protein
MKGVGIGGRGVQDASIKLFSLLQAARLMVGDGAIKQFFNRDRGHVFSTRSGNE